MWNFKVNNWVVAVAICSGMFISVLDNSSINIALPEIALQFRAEIPEVQWLTIGYGLASGALILPMGRLSDIIGRKRIYLTGFLISGLTAIITSIAPTLLLAIMFRTLQGVGGAMIQANAMAILIGSFPASRRGFIIGIFMTTVGIASVFGPVFGGFIVQYFSWRWLLFISFPLGLTACVVGFLILPQLKPVASESRVGSKFDWKGSFYFAVALSALMLTITNGHRLGWISPMVIALLITFLIFALLFAVRQARTDSPLIALELLERKYFSFGALASLFTFLTGTSVFFIMPFYLQGVLEYRPAGAGLMMTPMAGFFALSGPIAGYLSDQVGWKKVEIVGLTATVISLLGLSVIHLESSPFLLLFLLGLIGFGMGFFYSPNSASVLSVVERERYGVGTAFLQLTRNSASIIGISITTALITIVMGSMGYEPSLDAIYKSGVTIGLKNAFVDGLGLALRVQAVLVLVAVILTLAKGKEQKLQDIY